MKREDLQLLLVERGVNPTLYSLDGLAAHSECYSVVLENGLWKVVYKERGELMEIAAGLTEAEAYDVIYGKFQKAYGW